MSSHRKYACNECTRTYDNMIDYADHKLNLHKTKMIRVDGLWRKAADFIV